MATAATSALSVWLGWMSFATWLFAQFPQVIENYKRQSADGLALPFLASWLLGDITNLAGCILTHQLPFQKYLATYFVFVDMSLFAQYFYYAPKLTPPSREARARSMSVSMEREATHYRSISAVAANVAATAKLAASHDGGTMSPLLSRRATHDSEADVDTEDDALAALADSFTSDRPPKRLSWSRERGGTGRLGGPQALSPLTDIARLDERGRPLSRDFAVEDAQALADTAKRRNSRASRRSASLVFLAVWALVGLGRTVGPAMRAEAARTNTGGVLADVPLMVLSSVNVPAPTATLLSNAASEFFSVQKDESSDRVLGRIFAWTCTTLYLTSRLPQLWKNYVRKSVEGLSIYLFIFAFLGNFFYVSSILTSPTMSPAVLRESLPYLLGSGGVLMFDVSIVCQSLFYQRRKGHVRGRSGSTRNPEERAGLLTESGAEAA